MKKHSFHQSNCLLDICLNQYDSLENKNQERCFNLDLKKKKQKISLKRKLSIEKYDPLVEKKKSKEEDTQRTRPNTNRFESFRLSTKEGKQTSYGEGRLSNGSLFHKGNNIMKPINYRGKDKNLIGSQSNQLQLFIADQPDRNYYRVKSYTQQAIKKQKTQTPLSLQQILIQIHQPDEKYYVNNFGGLDTINEKQPQKKFFVSNKKKLNELQTKLSMSKKVHNDYESLFYSSDIQQRISQSTVHIDFFNPSSMTFSILQTHEQVNSVIMIEQ